MFTRLTVKILQLFPNLRYKIWQILYNQFAGRIRLSDWRFMNYGYALFPGETEPISVDARDAADLYGFRLYSHLISQVPVSSETQILEVGSGRGGGSFFISKYLKPASVTGLDYAPRATAFCNKNYVCSGLQYITGNAMQLPYDNDSVDIVINVESSHAYPSFDTFISEVCRVLKPGGCLLLADFRSAGEVTGVQQKMGNFPLSEIRFQPITDHVVLALEKENDRKLNLIQQHVPRWFQKYFLEFAGTIGTQTFSHFQSGKKVYFSGIWKKSLNG
ncbi:MAG: class I SAM-dependent methyltransferase [Bacteroidetes bacterium]|nr:class I SAM-dependent methyltransferase [Bacteroidota bacterium]